MCVMPGTLGSTASGSRLVVRIPDASLHYGAGAGTLKTSVRMAARTSGLGLRPRFCHFSSSTWASFASVGPEMVRPCERRKSCRAKSPLGRRLAPHSLRLWPKRRSYPGEHFTR